MSNTQTPKQYTSLWEFIFSHHCSLQQQQSYIYTPPSKYHTMPIVFRMARKRHTQTQPHIHMHMHIDIHSCYYTYMDTLGKAIFTSLAFSGDTDSNSYWNIALATLTHWTSMGRGISENGLVENNKRCFLLVWKNTTHLSHN